jgi:predicted nucleic acid-binding protein
MTWLIDTPILVDASRSARGSTNPAREFLARAAREGELWSVTPVRTELRWGVRDDEVASLRSLLDSIFWLDVTTDIADRAGALGQRYGRSHGLGVVDAIVAAAAEFLSADLATVNVKHFPMFPGLKRPY